MQRFRLWLHRSPSFHVLLALTLFTLTTVGSAAADGPVAPSSLPGGAPVGDDDPGSGVVKRRCRPQSGQTGSHHGDTPSVERQADRGPRSLVLSGFQETGPALRGRAA